MRIAICDDDVLQLQHIQSELNQLLAEREKSAEVCVFSDADALIDSIQTRKADIIILDIIMPLLSGMNAAREIRSFDKSAAIVFLTSSPEFAVESYDVKASGYLLKPIDREKFRRVIGECVTAADSTPDIVTFRTAVGYSSLPLQSIEFVEAQNKTVRLTRTDGTAESFSETFANMETYLSLEKGFFKCHRSYIVNLSCVDHFATGEIVLRSGAIVPIARGNYKPFHEAYFRFMFSEEKK